MALPPRELLDKALAGPHAHLVEPLVPDESSLFVVKARHSIFFETPLSYLLTQQGIDQLVLVGQVTEQCVLYSSLDAHIRHFQVTVPGTPSRTSTRIWRTRPCG